MPEPHPGLIRDDEPDDPTIPLKPVKVHPPDPQTTSRNWTGPTGTYTVRIQLSRQVTSWEKKVKMRPDWRVYGSTLEIKNTTLDQVDAGKAQIIEMMKAIEQAGRQQAEEHEERQTQAQLAHEAEEKRLTKRANEIRFD